MDINTLKKKYRKEIRLKKQQYTLQEKQDKSLRVFSKLESLDLFHKASFIFCYWAMDDEVQTMPFIEKWKHEKNIYLPAISGTKMFLKQFTGMQNLIPGPDYGIPEPKGEMFKHIEKIELAIVPGIAFDTENNRLGRGKAFYDSFLKNSKAYKVGVCFDFQYFKEVPAESHDIKMDRVLTDA